MSHCFADNKNRKYTVSMTLGRVRKIRESYGLDIFSNDDWQRITASLGERLAYLWFLVSDQAESFDLNLDAWELSLQGEGIASGASDAFFKELTDFYRRYDQQELAILTETQVETMNKARKVISGPDFQAKMNQQIEALLSGAT